MVAVIPSIPPPTAVNATEVGVAVCIRSDDIDCVAAIALGQAQGGGRGVVLELQVPLAEFRCGVEVSADEV